MKYFLLPNYRLRLYGLALSLVSLTSLSTNVLAAGNDLLIHTHYSFFNITEETPLDRGITFFKQGQYEEALEELQKAAVKNPADALTNLWLGLALEGNKQPYEAMAAWRKCYGNPKWEPIADYLKAMSWWRMGSTKDAISYFNDALLNVKDGKAVNFKPAKEAIKQVNEGQPVPPLSQWADLSTLTAPVKEEKKAPVTNNASSTSSVTKSNSTTTNTDATTSSTSNSSASKKAAETTKVVPGATPKAGKWVATISNGYKGDKLTFTISADGKRVENVTFTGHWRSRSWRTEVLTNLDPPQPFTVTKGNFSAVQQEEKAGMWWEFIGSFTSATAAEGSYRCTFAGGENDTYKLKWTARYVGK